MKPLRYSDKARLWLLPALDAPRVVIIRRKPAAWWHFILWNTDSNELTSGAWHKGSCYPEGADISPDGTLLAVSFGYDWGRGVATLPDLSWVLRWGR